MRTTCLNCGRQSEFKSASKDKLGWHTTCICGASFDIDVEDYLIPNGTKVKYYEDAFDVHYTLRGIVVGNDADKTDEFEDINYDICPLKYINKKVSPDHYDVVRVDEVLKLEDQLN